MVADQYQGIWGPGLAWPGEAILWVLSQMPRVTHKVFQLGLELNQNLYREGLLVLLLK